MVLWTRLGGASWSRPRKELAQGTHNASVSPSLFGPLSSLLGGPGGGTHSSAVSSPDSHLLGFITRGKTPPPPAAVIGVPGKRLTGVS